MAEAVAAAAALARVRDSPRPRVLFISHAERGGVARHIEGLALALEADVEVLLLQPFGPSHVVLRWMRSGEAFALYFDPKREWRALVAVLAAAGIDRLHLHHVHGLPRDVLDLPTALGCAHDVTLHDYFPACPAYHLTGGTGRYCAAEPSCQRCVDGHPAQWPLSIDAWRREFEPFLRTAERVIAPSEDTARRMALFFPGVPIRVWPHPGDDAPAPGRARRVLVPGAISPAKGLDLLEACAEDARARALPLHFRVLGFVARPIPTWPSAPLSIHGEYPEGSLPALAAQEGGDAFLFLAQCPETFSYTLSAAIDSGLPIVATALGAFPERLAGLERARLVGWTADAAEINDALLSLIPAPASLAGAPARTTFEGYRRQYLADWKAQGSGTRHGTATATIDSGWLVVPALSEPARPLAYLFEDGVVCGKAASRDQLRRYAFDPDSLHAATDARVGELLERAEGLEARAKQAEEALRVVERSRSGGLTARLRELARWMRGSA